MSLASVANTPIALQYKVPTKPPKKPYQNRKRTQKGSEKGIDY